ncbi:hypothetical protein CRENBAI_017031 [Crenichthys baileyi]|uniref:Uncharacterized protein n=1 Tax=Crenichthys baileyi TaxID=28760 RepID=A0AAV9SPF5_9TELE
MTADLTTVQQIVTEDTKETVCRVLHSIKIKAASSIEGPRSQALLDLCSDRGSLAPPPPRHRGARRSNPHVPTRWQCEPPFIHCLVMLSSVLARNVPNLAEIQPS